MSRKQDQIVVQNPRRVFLLGNGIVRGFCSGISCDDLIDEFCKGRKLEDLKGMHFPYALIVATRNGEDNAKKEIAKGMKESQKGDVGKLRKWLLGFIKDGDIILTTNYGYEIEKALDEKFKTSSKYIRWGTHLSKENKRTKMGRLEKHYCLDVGGKNVTVWHVHGEVSCPSSIAFGLYEYCRLIEHERECVARILKTERYRHEYNSWIECFLFGNVHVIGFGFDLAEIDLWSMVDCKCRHVNGGNNMITIHSYDLSKEVGMLADSYDLKVDSHSCRKGKVKYEKFYEKVASSIAVV